MKPYCDVALKSASHSVEIETGITASSGLKYQVYLPVLHTSQPRLTAQWSVIDSKLACKWLSA